MRRFAHSFLSISTFLGLSFGGLPVAHTETELLQSYRWENRILLVFAEDSDDVRYQQLKQNIDQEACEVGDRDLLVGYLFANDSNQPSTFADQVLSQSDVDRLGDRHNPNDSDFAVVLIGKDGGTKLRSSTLINLNPIFSEIDSMPMRQREMGDRSVEC